MRCYHLNNMYMSSIQQGIQSAHAQMELFVKYQQTTKQKSMLCDWATNHKTMIVLNGGFMSDMIDAYTFLDSDKNPYPYTKFHESEEALGGILTNIAIVLPEKSYKLSEFLRTRIVDEQLNLDPKLPEESAAKVRETLQSFGDYTQYEIELATLMNNFRLAS
jgi:hypothetical protein